MCGIGGIFNLNGVHKNLANELIQMGNKIRHRGPDDEGFVLFNEHSALPYFSDDSIKGAGGYSFSPYHHISEAETIFSGGFLHRRLSILDLSSGGHQPMNNGNNDIWITYNGEIYNYIELRDHLKSKGHTFYTRTDTEVILKAYEEWGVKCLDRFNGMFAFAIYDRRVNLIFAARDRFGVKPFYYFKDNDCFIFSSEQKGIRFNPNVKTGINTEAAFDFLAYSEIEKEPEGLFRNIFELTPSHYLLLDLKLNHISINKYYELSVNTKKEKFNTELSKKYVSEIKELFLNAVKIRTRSDVEVGSCLSGGIDSSSIVKVLERDREKNGEKLHLYTAIFPGEEIDEGKFANEVVNPNTSNWHKVVSNSQGLLDSLEDLIYSQDIPLWSSSTFAQYSVMKSVKDSGIKVVLDGQGGDELFAGYQPYFIPYWKEVYKNAGISALKNEWREFSGLVSSAGYFTKESLKTYLKGTALSPYFGSGDQSLFLSKSLRDENVDRKLLVNKFDSLNSMLSAEFFNDKLKVYLKCEDRCAMWHSIESRTPFADDLPLIEKVFSIPGIYKIHNGTSKYLLREAMKGLVPELILKRKDKMGYVTPHNKWLGEQCNKFLDFFDGSASEYIDENKIKKLLIRLTENHQKGLKAEMLKENTIIFKSLSFLIWKKKFNF